jgi:hypothetical protein
LKHKLLIGAACVLAAALLYTAAGYWLAPRLLHDALVKRAAAFGLALSVGSLRTDPFSLEAVFTDVEVAGRGGNRLAAAKTLRLDLAWSSLWRDDWIVQQASLQSPYVEVVLGPEGNSNWPRSAPNAPGEAAGLRVRAISVSDGTLRLLDRSRAAPVEVELRPVELQMENFATRAGEAQYRLSARLAEGGALSSAGTFSLAPLAAHGEIELAGASLAAAWGLAVPTSQPATGKLSARAAYAYQGEGLMLRDVYAEAHGIAYAGLELYKATIQAPELSLPVQRALAVSAHAQLKPIGSLSVRGNVQPHLLAATLDVEALSLPLPLAEGLLPPTMALHIASGSVSGKGRLQVERGRVAYDGSAELAELRLQERGSKRQLLGWKRARTDRLRFAAAPLALEMDEVVVQAPQARLVIEGDGNVNFGAVLQGDAGPGAPLAVRVGRLSVDNGTLEFADRSLDTPFEVTMQSLTGSVTGLTTAAGNAAQVALEGRVAEYGSVRIRGTLDIHEPRSLANITARFRNVGLAQLTPYVVKFAGYRVRSGRASADLRYRLRDGQLTGQNQLVFRELELGEKVEDSGAPDLPLELAVALLADASGRIALDIPVRGNLNDPQFDFGGLIARALGNSIRRIVSAPFRALTGWLGGEGDDLGVLRFEAGSAQLAPPQEENVARIAQALAARPQLGVVVRGGYDPERDAVALRRQAVRRDIAQRAGYSPGGPLNLGDPKTVQAAERLYLERIGTRSDLRALRKEAPSYGRALLELLAYTLPEDTAGSPENLALERARTVRAAIAGYGVAPGRIVLEPPVAEKGDQEGVRTQLALRAAPQSGDQAAAGGTAASRQP